MTKATLVLIASVFTAFFSFFYIIIASIIPSIFNSVHVISLSQTLVCFIAGLAFIIASFRINGQSNTVKLILICLTLTVLTLIPVFFTSSIYQLILISISSIFFSIGQACILTYFWKYTPVEKRGVFGGLICSVFLTVSFIIYLTVSQESLLSYFVAILIPIILSIIITSINVKTIRPTERIYKKTQVEKRVLLLFLAPWIFFCIINFTFSKNIDASAIQFVSANFEEIVIIQNVFPIVGAVTGGLIADFIGRKPSAVISSTIYGLSIVLSAFFQNSTVLLCSFAIEGISWGMFFTLYLFVIWGDLANEKNCSKLYALGIGTYIFAIGLGQLPSGLTNLSPETSALIACSLIFFSSLPITLSPELLSLEARNKRNLKGYIKKIKKLEPLVT
ncbi:MAG: hypothetical protein NWF01_07775 [Candidatus Bathyarchaeota archaeon]|nr:hypothetical protein [Candidatus Bathyarchaeota archaeon]